MVKGNPGKALVAMNDILDKYNSMQPDLIDSLFIASYVYPYGFYSDDYFLKVYDEKRYKNPDLYKYAFLFLD